ncbi:hypothetical protein BJV78DRAFT_1074394, partial [Lactifluus subvellereus]
PTEQEIWKTTRRTIDIIEDNLGTKNVCLFGSAASALWADIGRVPNDIDLVISAGRSEHFDPEDIKEIIVNADNRYYLEPSKQRNANHKVLYCRLPGWWIENRCVKVDILVPPTLGIPRIFSSNAFLINDIPVMPLFDLLVMKLQGWRDHSTSLRPDFRAKVGADVTDVRALLNRAISE